MLTDLYRIASAATDAGVLDWLRTLVLSGAFFAIVRSTVGRALGAVLVMMAMAHAAVAQPAGLSNDEIERRLQFLDGKLAAEQSQARWYEAGWSAVYVGGVGYGAYQLGNGGGDNAAIAEGIVSISKSLIGAGTLVLKPLKAGHTLRDLYGHESDPAERLALAESLLERNAKESDLRYRWQPHVIALALNLLGGAIVWIAGDVKRAGESTGIAVAVAEVQLWTLPWGAKRHAREYRREFGGFAF